MDYILREITKADDSAIAVIIRENLEKFGLDIPGTVYFDDGLDHLSELYINDSHYYIAESEGKVIGGIGFAPFLLMKDTAELQKLYLSEDAKGSGIGYELVSFIEEKMRAAGFKWAYLETHDNLQAAIHIYSKSNYIEIERPKDVAHSSMNRFFRKEL
ncbi:MAG: GNAT family N-acetyltransferase [Lachnospiraceae bacterium]|nr:GNAT family N-acetyltransferase [Lachnospiraceae bacterium]